MMLVRQNPHHRFLCVRRSILSFYNFSIGFWNFSDSVGFLFFALLKNSGHFCMFSPDTQVSLTNKHNRHDITEMLLKEALNTINHPPITPLQ